MKISPVWAIFGFVTSSILVAGGYHSLTLAQKESSATPLAWDLSLSQLQGLWGTPISVCEHSEQQNRWKDFPPIYRSARYRHGGDFQMQCLKTSSEELPSFAGDLTCPGESLPGIACEQREESLVTFNVLLDLTDCFEISQREFLPLIASQTGPRLSRFAVDQEGQPGLLRQQDWLSFQNAWPGQLALLKSSEKTSCRRLGALFDKAVLPESPQLCEAGQTPQKQLIVMLASAARFAEVTAQIRDSWDPALIDPLMSELDTQIEDRMILRYWTHLLAYFETSDQAIGIAKTFVEARGEYGERIKPGELSWAQLANSNRQPASVGESTSEKTLTWPRHLQKRLDPVVHGKMGRVAKWLNWVRGKELSGACGTELWTMEMAPALTD
jgi:hypothetical protein